MSRISLDTPHACRQELERVANATAQLAVEKTTALEQLETLEEQWELVEAAAFNAAPHEKGDTATQIKARAVEAIAKNEKTATLRKNVRAKRAEITRLDQRMDALEARGSYAQSAIKAHDMEARFSSYGGSG